MEPTSAGSRHDHASDGKCQPVPKFVETPRLSRAYVPLQKFCESYDPEKGLRRGTIYPELDMPYERPCAKQSEPGMIC